MNNKKPFKKNPNFAKHYEPVSKNKKTGKSENDRKYSASNIDIPGALKRNIAMLNDSTDSAKLTEFGKSFVGDEELLLSPPKQSKFDILLSEDLKNNTNTLPKFENRRLASLKNFESPQIGLLSSPSIMKLPKSPPKLTFPIESEKVVTEDIVEQKHLSFQDNSHPVSSKNADQTEKNQTEVVISVSDEKVVAENLEKTDDKSNDVDVTTTGRNIINDYKASADRFREMLANMKGLGQQILAFREELCKSQSTPTS